MKISYSYRMDLYVVPLFQLVGFSVILTRHVARLFN